MTDPILYFDISEFIESVDAREKNEQGKEQIIFQFINGWSVSVIRGPLTYGGDEGLFELCVFGTDHNLSEDNPVTDGDSVLGWLSVADVYDKVRTVAYFTEKILADYAEMKRARERTALYESIQGDILRLAEVDTDQHGVDTPEALPFDVRRALSSLERVYYEIKLLDVTDADNWEE